MSGEFVFDYPSVRDYLYGLKHRGALYGIDRMEKFSEALGHPERSYPIIHVAGTNGKGSTCAILESILRASGLKTGMFTSPHLVHQGERIQVNRNILSHDAIVNLTRELKDTAETVEENWKDHHPSFFEFMTGMAFYHFEKASVDVGIIETGLGGRLDATNVVQPEIAVITSIGLDHMDILGDTYAKIAFEKGGIIKPGKPVVLGIMPAEAEKVLREIAAERGCRVYAVNDIFGDDLSSYPQCALPGSFQKRNAATAVLAMRALNELSSIRVSHAAIDKGLSTVKWAGRWEHRKLKSGQTIILDATHNEEGGKELDRNLSELIASTGRKPTIVVGTLGESRAKSLIPKISKHAESIYLVEPNQPRACTFDELKRFIPGGFKGDIINSEIGELFPAEGISKLGQPKEFVVVTGSIYLIGEIYEALFYSNPVNEQLLQD